VPLDPAKAKATVFSPCIFDVERGRLRLFATAIGEPDAVYTDLATARAHGHRDLPVPPTFFMTMENETHGLRFLADLGVDMGAVLHGEQHFVYRSMAYAGDQIEIRPRIADVYSKKGRALDFIVRESDFTRNGELVAQSKTVVVIVNRDGGAS
jgi:N-terminal half of MaoC dehydratase